jgi:hypothetical protein
LSGSVCAAGDVLIMQAQYDLPLLKQPPSDLHKRKGGEGEDVLKGGGSATSLMKKLTGSLIDAKSSELARRETFGV